MSPPPSTPSNEKVRAELATAWEKRTDEWEALAKAQGIKMPPGVKIDPKEVRMEIGPPMTAEEFKAWHDRRKNIMKKFSQ